MARHEDWDILRSKVVTLLAINVLQPVELKSLKRKLKSQIKPREIDNVLKELIAQNKVAVDAKHYRVKYVGLESIVPNKGRFLRDNLRMEHLIRLTKQRGGR